MSAIVEKGESVLVALDTAKGKQFAYWFTKTAWEWIADYYDPTDITTKLELLGLGWLTREVFELSKKERRLHGNTVLVIDQPYWAPRIRMSDESQA